MSKESNFEGDVSRNMWRHHSNSPSSSKLRLVFYDEIDTICKIRGQIISLVFDMGYDNIETQLHSEIARKSAIKVIEGID